MQSKTAIVILCLLAVVFSACGPDLNSRYGTNYNPERANLGIATIPKDWKFDSGNGDSWYNPELDEKLNNHIAFHASKTIAYLNGHLSSEQDIYYGSVDYNDEAGLRREELSIEYCYQIDDQCVGKSNWSIVYDSQRSMDTRTFFISLDEAKTILKTWGLSYP